MGHNPEKHIKIVIDHLAREQNLKKITYEKKTSGDSGINFMANITHIRLKDEVTDKVLDVIIKIAPCAPCSPAMDDILEEFYKREVYFYNSLVPVLKSSTNVSFQGFIPECYFADLSNRVVAMEDMALQGFKRYDNGMFFDQEHVIATLQAVAKFHALSMILNEKDNVKLPKDNTLKSFSGEHPEFYCKSQRLVLRKYLPLFKGMKCEKSLHYLYREINDSTEFLDGIVTKAKCLVYGHGDMWKENILFKYSDQQSTKPVQVCLIDFQMTRIMCPAAEVLFFIMNSTESSVRRPNFKRFISVYYQTLQDVVKNSVSKSEIAYSLQDLHDDLKLVATSCFSLLFISFVLWLRIDVPESIINNCMDISDVQSDAIIAFKEIIENVVRDLTEFGLIGDQCALPQNV